MVCTGGYIKTERTARGKAVEENNRKADFMLGGLHLISSQYGGDSVRSCLWIYCHLVVCDCTAELVKRSQKHGLMVRVNSRRLGQAERSKLEPLSQGHDVM